MSPEEPLLATLAGFATALDAAGFGYAIIGAFARNAWARPRATTDADLAVAVTAERLGELRRLVAACGLRVRKERCEPSDPVPELMLLERVDCPDVRLDLLVVGTPFEDSVIARRLRVSVGGTEVWLASPEDLVVYKLVAGRPHDYADAEDVAIAVGLAGRSIDWNYVDFWCTEFAVDDRARGLRERVAGSGREE